MDDKYFLSYSRIDASDSAVRLTDQLAAGPPPFAVWLDAREIKPGQDWDEQIVEAIRTCRALLFVMTPDGVKPNSMCKREWTRALKYKKPVIPLRFDQGAELPFRLDPREYVDFTDPFQVALARLRNHLTWLDTPEGVLQALKQRLADAERELERPSEADTRTRIEQDVKELRRQIANQERLLADPGAARERAQDHIASGLEREREPDRAVTVRQAKFVNPPPLTAPAWFQDRHVETGQIGDFLREDGLRLLTVVGRGGIGKTAMVCRLLKALEGGRLPDEYGPLEVDGIVYLSPVGAHKVNFPNLFADLTRLLPEATAQRLDQLYQDPQLSPTEQMLALLEAFPGGRSVLLLDNFEDVVDAETLAISDSALDEALRTLLTAPGHGVKVMVTTRVAPKELLLLQPALQRRLNLDEGLGSPYAENLLRAMDPDGTLGLKNASDELLATARERTRGYPRALEALVAILAADRDTSLPELLAETRKLLPDNVVKALVGEAFNRLDPLAQQVMQALAICGLPVPPVAVDYLLQPFLVAIDSAPVLSRLVNMQFARRDAGRYYLHPVDREYALGRLPEGQPADRDAIEPLQTRYALLGRAADYFEQTRTPRESWKQLEDLRPQLAEFELRYEGQDYHNAAAVLLEIDFDYLLLWGHYRLMVQLHERLRGRLTDPDLEQASIGNLGTALQSMGQYDDAIHCHQQALALVRLHDDRQGEATWLGNLGISYGVQGKTQQAIDAHQQALTIFREVGHRQGEANALSNLAGSYGVQGKTQQAIDAHQQVLTIYREIGDRQGQARSLAGLASRYGVQGKTQQAVDAYKQALTIYREIGNRQGEAGALGGLADGYTTQGKTQQAIDAHQQALTIYREIGDPQGEAGALTDLGSSYGVQGKTQQAIDAHQQALTIFREVGDPQGEANALTSLGSSYGVQGKTQQAIDAHQQALTIDREIGNRQGEANALTSLGSSYGVQGKTQQAIDAHQQALTIYREIGHLYGEGVALSGLADGYANQGKTQQAIDAHQQALTIDREVGDRQGEAIDLTNLAVCDVDQAAWEQAERRYNEAIRIADDIGLVQTQGEARYGLASAQLFQGALAAARQTAEAARTHVVPTNNANVSALLGIVLLRQGALNPARVAFTQAISQADALLEQTSHDYGALDTKALALSGLALLGEASQLVEATATVRAARAINHDAGVVRRVVRLLEALAVADQAGSLRPVRTTLTRENG